MSRMFILGAATAAFAACTPDPELGRVELEEICGGRDWQEVEQYDGTRGVPVSFVAAHERPVGLLAWRTDVADRYADPGEVAGVKLCSGTLIAPDLFLTAAHCFESTSRRLPIGTDGQPIGPDESATNMEVRFNHQVSPEDRYRPVTAYRVEAMVERRGGDHDYAVLRLAGNPGATWGWTPVEAAVLTPGESLTIIQHPRGYSKKIDSGSFRRYRDEERQIAYDDIDTLPGSSGAGILSARGTVIGVHAWGGCDPGGGGSNAGTPILAIILHSPVLRDLARPACASDADCVSAGCVVSTCAADGRCTTAPKCGQGVCGVCDAVTFECLQEPRSCDDQDDCTVDTCDPARGCVSSDDPTCG